MKLKPQYITLAVLVALVGAGLYGFNYVRANGVGGFLGATPSNGDFVGIYNATPTDLGLRDGYGSALLTDANGRLVISPSSTVPAGSLTMSSGVANGVLFLDASKVASSTSAITADGNLGSATMTRLYLGDGTASAPTLAFAGGSHGIYRAGASVVVGVSGNGILTVGANQVTVTGVLLPNTDNTRDFGGVSTRWNDGWFGGNVTSTSFVANSSAFAVGNGFQVMNGSVAGGILADTTYLYLGTLAGGGATVRTTINGTSQIDLTTAGLIPSLTDGTKNIGSQTARFGTGFFVNVSSTNATTTYAYAYGDTSRPAFAIVDPSTGSVNNGMGMSSSNYLNMLTAGNLEFQIGPVNYSNSNLSAYTDNSHDIGQSASSFRFRHAYFAGNVYGSTLNASTTAGSALDALSTSGTVKMFGLAALAATGDFVCENNTTVGAIQVQAGNCTVSSAFFKKHIESLSNVEMMALVRKLRAVEYDQKADGRHEKGFIAEEVARIDPTLVVYAEPDSKRLAWVKANYPDVIIKKDGKPLVPQTVDYMRSTSVLTAAMQNLDERLTKLESK